MYIFMKVFFKTNLFIRFSHSQIQEPKSYTRVFNLNFVQNNFLYVYEESK